MNKEINKEIKKLIEKAKNDKKVLAVALFGSSLNGKGRDIDICIFLDKKYSNLEMSKKRMRLLLKCPSNFDIQIFQQLPVYIRKRILKEAKILFCKNLPLLYEIYFQTIKEFNFFEKLYNMYLEKVQNG